MGQINGIGGAVDGIPTIRTWTISSSADLQKFAASNTAGAVGAEIGNDDWSGSYTAYGHTPAKMPGEIFDFKGSIDGDNGAWGSAIVDSCEIAINIESGALIAHTVNFSANGALTLGTAVAADVTVPDSYTSIGCKVELGAPAAPPGYAGLDNVRSVTLRFNAANVAYVDSSTGGSTKRHGGNVTCEGSIAVYTDDFNSLPEPNDIHAMKIYVNATEFWELKWIMFGEAGDMLVDRESAAEVGATLGFAFVVAASIADVRTMGEITKPNEEIYWPAA